MIHRSKPIWWKDNWNVLLASVVSAAGFQFSWAGKSNQEPALEKASMTGHPPIPYRNCVSAYGNGIIRP
jgi:hypothetical protein